MNKHTRGFSTSQTLITGVYRTGSEYLSLLLDAHPDLSVTMYRVNILRFVYQQYGALDDRANLARALRDTAERLQKRYQLTLNVDSLLAQLSSLGKLTHGILYDAIMSELYLNDAVTHWAEKNQLLWREIPVFLDMMNNGRAIHIIRDPRSVVASFQRYTRYPEPAYLGAIFNCADAMKTARQHLEASNKRIHLVQYEQLARNPEDEIRKIWEFMGLRQIDGNIQESEWTDAYGEAWHSNSSFHRNDSSDSFDVNKAINGWRTRLSSDDINFVETICGDLMDFFNYERVGRKVNLQQAADRLKGNQQLERALTAWQETGRGIQEFPVNPLDETTWS